MQDAPYMCTRNVDGVQLDFRWHGGAYIEVGRRNGTAQEVINVWDYRTDKPRIERTQKAMAERVDEWIADYNAESPQALVHDVTCNWAPDPPPSSRSERARDQWADHRSLQHRP